MTLEYAINYINDLMDHSENIWKIEEAFNSLQTHVEVSQLTPTEIMYLHSKGFYVKSPTTTHEKYIVSLYEVS